MRDRKTWLVLGAEDGLGPAAVKYLQAHKQIVRMNMEIRPGPLDFIINNSNYNLFSKGKPDLDSSVAATIAQLRAFVPYLKPDGAIINIPPQLCLSTLADLSKGPDLLQAMDLFLAALYQKMEPLNCRLHFLGPGERFVQL